MSDFEFHREHDGSLTTSAAVHQALGAASACWETLGGAGVFDEATARSIGTALLTELGFTGDEPAGGYIPPIELTTEEATALARFTRPNFAVPGARGDGAEALREYFYAAALKLIRTAPHSKSRSVALTELETALMWAIKAYYGAPGESNG